MKSRNPGEIRRDLTLKLLQRGREPVTGAELAKRLGVSRQVVVQDIAILRAAGSEVVATPRGYLMLRPAGPAQRAMLACRHNRAETEAELTILVDHGLRVVDVIVEHPLYGDLRGLLMLESRADVSEFIARLERSGAGLLSALTGGVHLHTVEATRVEAIEHARDDLRKRGILLETGE